MMGVNDQLAERFDENVNVCRCSTAESRQRGKQERTRAESLFEAANFFVRAGLYRVAPL